jgi:hypothetical protein
MAGISRRAFLALAGHVILVGAAAPYVRAAALAPLFHGPRDARVIALTIDDDWSSSRVGVIFDPRPAPWDGVKNEPSTVADHADPARRIRRPGAEGTGAVRSRRSRC